jgi:hypothetical protein
MSRLQYNTLRGCTRGDECMLAHVNMPTSRVDGQSHTRPGELGARTLNTTTNPLFNNLFDMLDASVDDRERGAVCIPYESYPSVPKPPLPPTRKKGGESESQPGNPKPRTLVELFFPGFGEDSIDCRAADSTSRQVRFRRRVSLIGAPPILTQSGRGEDQVVEPRSKPINSASTHSGLVEIYFPGFLRQGQRKVGPPTLNHYSLNEYQVDEYCPFARELQENPAMRTLAESGRRRVCPAEHCHFILVIDEKDRRRGRILFSNHLFVHKWSAVPLFRCKLCYDKWLPMSRQSGTRDEKPRELTMMNFQAHIYKHSPAELRAAGLLHEGEDISSFRKLLGGE